MKLIKQTIRKLLPHSTIESLRIDINRIQGNSPIIIYTMGKVGSTTAYQSLAKTPISNPVYHVHFLTQNGIEHIENKYRNANASIKTSAHLVNSKIIRPKILKSNNKSKFKVISLAREPISLSLSHFLQNPKVHRPHLVKYLNQENIKGLNDCFLSELENNSYIHSWFDEEFNNFLGIDIYQYNFDYQRGYSILNLEKFDILLMRIKDMSNLFNKAIKEFLDIETPVELVKANERENQEFSNVYQKLKNEIVVPPEICEKVYSSKYVNYFYSASDQKKLIDKWSNIR